ncbi:hypothetical protein [Oceanivirga miroungae]|uniref:Uncharacterized protein n=1 Tax=Oceanivirga miroungae TaxID=1130046 RepID=A0A6I8M8V4_9FUSO|nr:hypothetical protein [Oceanivirga miroungae]VWL85245.1 hypothetical protein OMES3154_00528 [Oceanivirga miroungae]
MDRYLITDVDVVLEDEDGLVGAVYTNDRYYSTLEEALEVYDPEIVLYDENGELLNTNSMELEIIDENDNAKSLTEFSFVIRDKDIKALKEFCDKFKMAKKAKQLLEKWSKN